MHYVHFILTYSISVYSFWNGSNSHLPNLYNIQESHLIIPETSAVIERAFSTAKLILNDRLTDIMFEQMFVAKLNGNFMRLSARDMFIVN